MKPVWYSLAALFFIAGAVQFNDPDSARWVALYWVAAVVCGVWPSRLKLRLGVSLAVLLLAFLVEITAVLWGGVLIRDVWAVGRVDLGAEVQREFGGILIVAIAMSIAISGARRVKRADAGPTGSS